MDLARSLAVQEMKGYIARAEKGDSKYTVLLYVIYSMAHSALILFH